MKSIKKFFYAAMVAAGLATSFVACVDNDFDQPEIVVPKFDGQSNSTIVDLKAKHTSGEFETITEDLIIEGYVVSDDTEGNFYKQIIIQDSREGATGGIEVKINDKGLSSTMKPGQKVFIKVKGLVLGDYNGLIQLGGGTFKDDKYTNLAGIDPALVKDHIFLDGMPVDLQPKEVSLEELQDNDLYNSLVSTLVKVTAAQFSDSDLNKTYAEDGKSQNRTLVGPKGNTLIVRNSGYSNFWDTTLPGGSGTIVGVLSKFGSDKQMVIRSLDDVVMTADRFGDAPVDVPTPNATAADVKAKLTGDVVTISEDLIFDATVISNEGTSSNFYNKVIVQDETAGIEIRAYKSDYLKALAPGQKVVIKVKDLVMGKYGESVQIGVPFNDGVGGMNDEQAKAHIIKDEGGVEPTPAVLTLDALTLDKVNTLVKIENVQFKDSELTKTYADADGDFKSSVNRYLTDAAGKEIIVRTANTASFAGETVADKSGSIVGILSKFGNDWQLYIRSTADVTMEADRFDVTNPNPVQTAIAKVFFTEYAEGTSNNKYVEFYNNTGADIDLANYTVRSAPNGGAWADPIELTGTLANGEVYVISTDQANDAIKAEADLQLSYPSPIHYSGDDAVGLFKKEGEEWVLIDAIGKQGEKPDDGWEVAGITAATKNHTLVRKSETTESNPDWTTAVNEWNVLDIDDNTNIGVFGDSDNGNDDGGDDNGGDDNSGDNTSGTVETFDNAALTTSYADGSFVGVNNITWTYVASRDHNGDANNSGIAGNAIMLRRSSSDSKITSSTISGGIKSFKVKMYKGFTGGGDRQIEVFVNGNSVGQSTAFDDFDMHEFVINDINVSGDFTIEIRNITAKQIIIDDITLEAMN
jgi:hypothetical protein